MESNESGEARKKSAKDVYSELIKKSKQYKHERQKLKELAFEKQEQVNEDFNAIKNLLAFRAKGQKDIHPQDEYNQMILEVEGEKRLKANDKEKKIRKQKLEEKESSQEDPEDVNDWIGKIKRNKKMSTS